MSNSIQIVVRKNVRAQNSDRHCQTMHNDKWKKKFHFEKRNFKFKEGKVGQHHQERYQKVQSLVVGCSTTKTKIRLSET